MKTRYAVIYTPYFGIVPVFYTRQKAVVFCSTTRQHIMNIYPKYLGYVKKGNIYKSPTHTVLDSSGLIIYKAEIVKQILVDGSTQWSNAD